MPKSGIGKAVTVGVIIGLLLVLMVAVSAAVASAQSHDPFNDPKYPGVSAQDPGLPAQVRGASPYPDSAVCKGWMMFESGEYDRRIADGALNGSMNAVRDRLRLLCGRAPDDEKVGADSAAWLAMVDGVFDTITTALMDRMSRPVSAKDRVVLQDILQSTAIFQRDFEILRTQAYASETVRVVESVKTVEVPVRVPCPVVETPLPPRDPCVDALRQGADHWASQLYEWTDWYRGSGGDWSLADSSKNDLRSIANGNGDPRSYVVGWLAQWRSIRRQDSTSFLGSGPMPQIAADMRAQLASCGISSEER